jgi:hypothetical protein
VEHQLDVARALGGLATRADCWRFIEDFAAGWATPISAGDGISDRGLDAAEDALGVRLPAAVWEAYRLFGRRRDLTSRDGCLLPPNELRYDHDDDVLVFRAAHQGVAHWGVSLGDVTAEDPPTFITTVSWEPFVDRFSLACVDMVLWEMVEAGPHSDGRDERDDDSATLFSGLTQVPFPRYPDKFDTRWYVNADVILRHYPGWIAVCARTGESLDAFRRTQPGDWVNE